MPKAMSDWIAKNLWAILALIGGTAQGYNVGTSAMATMKSDIDGIKAAGAQRREFINEAKDRLEYLCNRDKECSQRFDPMKVPE